MTLTYGFYNSLNGDRKYDAEQISSMFDGITSDGVFESIGTHFTVLATTGMNIEVGIGRAWFNHTWFLNTPELIIAVDPSEVVLNRIDTVILEVNSDAAVRANALKVLKGTPATTPVPPTLTNAGTLHQYPLCDILIEDNITDILQAYITNRIGTVDCPYVTGILELDQIPETFKATAAEVAAGTSDLKFATPKSIKDSVNVPNVAPGAAANVLTSEGGLWVSKAPGASGIPMECRLTLTAGVPFQASDIVNATAIHLAPFNGNKVAIWNGTDKWDILACPNTGPFLTVTSFAASRPHDIFVYNNAGVIALAAQTWNSANSPAVGLVLQDGVLVKYGATSQRYIGTIYTDAASQLQDTITKRFVWNYYNQKTKHMARINVSAHAYPTGVWRFWNNSQVNSQVEFVLGNLSGQAIGLLGIYRANITVGGGGVAFGPAAGPAGSKGEQFNNVGDAASSDVFNYGQGYGFWAGAEYGGGSFNTERISMTMEIDC